MNQNTLSTFYGIPGGCFAGVGVSILHKRHIAALLQGQVPWDRKFQAKYVWTHTKYADLAK